MKLWDKGYSIEKEVEEFTVGEDYILDMELVEYDCIASKAHAKMLYEMGVLTIEELNKLLSGLDEIIKLHENGKFKIAQSDEDSHTAIEKYLVNKFGKVGAKIHTGRSRNDQVLTALRLYEKSGITKLIIQCENLSKTLKNTINKYGNIQIPGYTHMRKAMPTSVKTWLESFIESINDDICILKSNYDLINQSPLGTAAGFGVQGLKIDQYLTSDLLGFKKPILNPMYAQLTRGKYEAEIINACSQVMLSLNKIASDFILFSMTEFGFIGLPKSFCTGSSIMPQKLNPDTLELVRAKYHVVITEEFKVKSLIGNLISGYNRDVQLTKKSIIDSFKITSSSISIMDKLIANITINEKECKEAMTSELYATQKVNELVMQGVPFREAYKTIGVDYVN